MASKKSKSKGRSPRRTPSIRISVMSLRALRESLGKTQDEVAAHASMTQPQLSRVERRRDHLVSTLRKYVQAMGGDVEVIARIADRHVVLRDV